MVEAQTLATIRIDPPKDWLDAPPHEAAPEHWGAVPVDDYGNEAPIIAPDPEPEPAPEEPPAADPEAFLRDAGAVIETPDGPDPVAIARLAATAPVRPVRPLYLRAPDARLPI